MVFMSDEERFRAELECRGIHQIVDDKQDGKHATWRIGELVDGKAVQELADGRRVVDGKIVGKRRIVDGKVVERDDNPILPPRHGREKTSEPDKPKNQKGFVKVYEYFTLTDEEQLAADVGPSGDM